MLCDDLRDECDENQTETAASPDIPSRRSTCRASHGGLVEHRQRRRLEALTMRACARRAGVSHAAPEHHFGSPCRPAGRVRCRRLRTSRRCDGRGCRRNRAVNRYLQPGSLTFVLPPNIPRSFASCRRSLPVRRNRRDCGKASRATRSRLEDRAPRPLTWVATIASRHRSHFRQKRAWQWLLRTDMRTLRADGFASETDVPNATALLSELRLALLAE